MIKMGEYDVVGVEDFVPGPGNRVSINANGVLIAEYSFDCATDMMGNISCIITHYADVYDIGNRRRGISTELIRLIDQFYGGCYVKFLNCTNNTVADKNGIRYSEEGLAWALKCCSQGIAKSDFEEDFGDFEL